MTSNGFTRAGGTLLATGLFVLAATAASGQGTATPATPQGQSAAGAARPTPTTALQDARVTLTRLTERSMTQDAREAFARLSTSFRALYKAYTGEEPTPQKTAGGAAAGAAPASDWKTRYDAVTASLTAMAGSEASAGTNSATATSGQVGTSGTSPGGMPGLTQEVRADLALLRDQLTRFYRAAGGNPAQAPSPSGTPRF